MFSIFSEILVILLIVVYVADAQRRRNRNRNRNKNKNGLVCHLKDAEKCLDSLSALGKGRNPTAIIATSEGLDKLCRYSKFKIFKQFFFFLIIKCLKVLIKRF
jgi:hypothetical protein